MLSSCVKTKKKTFRKIERKTVTHKTKISPFNVVISNAAVIY